MFLLILAVLNRDYFHRGGGGTIIAQGGTSQDSSFKGLLDVPNMPPHGTCVFVHSFKLLPKHPHPEVVLKP